MKKILFSIFFIVIINSLTAQNVSNMEFLDNERVAVNSQEGTHIVLKGETLSSIGRMYNTSFQHIQLINKLSDSNIKEGQILLVPTSTNNVERGGPMERKGISSEGLLYAKKQLSHTVQAGDDIYSISDDYGVPIDEIRKLNNLGNNVFNFKIGEQIIYKESYETATSKDVAESTKRKATTPNTPSTTTTETSLPPLSTPVKNTTKIDLPASTIVEPIQSAIVGERKEQGTYIVVEDKLQKDPFYIYHKTLKKGMKVRLLIPDNAGYIDAIVANRIDSKRQEIVGLSPDCLRIIGGRSVKNITITYLP